MKVYVVLYTWSAEIELIGVAGSMARAEQLAAEWIATSPLLDRQERRLRAPFQADGDQSWWAYIGDEYGAPMVNILGSEVQS
jgi:hypothetical protein